MASLDLEKLESLHHRNLGLKNLICASNLAIFYYYALIFITITTLKQFFATVYLRHQEVTVEARKN